jgi:hypothetical protein
LTYYFLHPESINAEQRTILAQLPKRLGYNRHLAASLGEEETGCGLHVEKDWHWATIYTLGAVLVSFSLAFGMTWAVLRKDMQGGMAVSSYVVGLESLLLGPLLLSYK